VLLTDKELDLQVCIATIWCELLKMWITITVSLKMLKFIAE